MRELVEQVPRIGHLSISPNWVSDEGFQTWLLERTDILTLIEDEELTASKVFYEVDWD